MAEMRGKIKIEPSDALGTDVTHPYDQVKNQLQHDQVNFAQGDENYDSSGTEHVKVEPKVPAEFTDGDTFNCDALPLDTELAMEGTYVKSEPPDYTAEEECGPSYLRTKPVVSGFVFEHAGGVVVKTEPDVESDLIHEYITAQSTVFTGSITASISDSDITQEHEGYTVEPGPGLLPMQVVDPLHGDGIKTESNVETQYSSTGPMQTDPEAVSSNSRPTQDGQSTGMTGVTGHFPEVINVNCRKTARGTKRFSQDEVIDSFIGDVDNDDGNFDLADDCGDSEGEEDADSDWEYDCPVHVDAGSSPLPRDGPVASTSSVRPTGRKRPRPTSSSESDVELHNSDTDGYQPPILSDYVSSADDSDVGERDNVVAPLRDAPQQRGRQPARVHERASRRDVSPAWAWEKCNGDDFDPVDIPFTGQEGLKVRMGPNSNPIDFFNLYVTDELIAHFVTETNRFAQQYIAAKGDQLEDNSRVKAWNPTKPEEMKTFLGLILLMGIVLKPRIHMYWATDELVSTPIFSQAMTRDRFQLILKYFHFANNEDPNFDAQDPDRYRLHKVRPVIEMIRTRLAQVYSPGKNLCIDESLVLYKGRLAFRQFIRTKRAPFGIKLYELCTSSGITLDFVVYCGKGMIGDDDPNDDMSATERIPANLMIPYLGAGHCLFIDNFYTSPKLADHLLRSNTYVCGTINPKRKDFPRECANANLENGEAAFYKQNDKHLLGVKFRAMQNKPNNQPKLVCMLSTFHRALVEDTGDKDRNGADIRKPSCILSYNKQMGGVDRVDEQLHGIHTLHKTSTWYKQLVLHLVLQSALNAHKVYQLHTGNENVDFLGFLNSAIGSLLRSSPRLNQELVAHGAVARLTGRHWPERKKPTEGATQKNPCKMCRVCYAKGLRTPSGAKLKTVWVCKTCVSEPGLHIDEGCFEAFHTKLDYSK